jgi:orotate phosphoribosyltransferase
MQADQSPEPVARLEREAARTMARILLETRAVNFRPEQPFVFTSGRVSPVYIDCRKLISFPRARKELMRLGVALLSARAGLEAFDAVAGGETAGIPFAAWIAERMSLPMLYVRKKPKGFGRNAQIEGHFGDGDRVLLVEDLATDAGSKLGFVKALRDAGATVEHCFVLFHYGIFPQALRSLEEIGVTLHALANWYDVLREARLGREFSAASLNEVAAFLDDPDGWAARNAHKAPAKSGAQ